MKLHLGLVEPIHDLVLPLLHFGLENELLVVKSNLSRRSKWNRRTAHLTDVHASGLLEVGPRGVDDGDVVHLVP